MDLEELGVFHSIELSDGEAEIFAFDTETTGIDPFSDHIITWGLSSVDEVEREEVLQLPDGIEPSPDAVKVHGYSPEKIKKLGKPRIEGLIELVDTLDALHSRGAILIGHNVVYDMTILYNELLREGLNEEAAKCKTWNVLDTFVLLESSIGMFKMKYKLNVVSENFGVPKSILNNAHNAGADSLVAVSLLDQIMLYFPHLGAMNKSELLEYTVKSAYQLQYRRMAMFKGGDNVVGYPISEKVIEKPELASDTNDSSDERSTTRKRSSSRSKRTQEPAQKSEKKKSISSKKPADKTMILPTKKRRRKSHAKRIVKKSETK